MLTETMDRWPAGVPKNNDEMIKTYDKVIMAEIYRRNIVKGNASDHYQEVVLKLIQGKVLEKFVKRVLSTTYEDKPETMTTSEVCVLLGITFSAWRSRQRDYLKNFVERLSGKLPEDRTNDDKGTLFVPGHPKPLYWVSWMPQPIEGSAYSPNSVYRTSDILDVHERPYFKKSTFQVDAWPKREVEPHHFQAYLLQAVRNHFYNACRTIRRKHKDRPGDCFQAFNNADGEYNENWEDGLKDEYATESIESSASFREKLTRLTSITNTIGEDKRDEILDLLEKNHSIREIVKKVDMTEGTKRRLMSLCTEV
jgi:DNA-directed RNA polymerase specialized sigma24 family protein